MLAANKPDSMAAHFRSHIAWHSSAWKFSPALEMCCLNPKVEATGHIQNLSSDKDETLLRHMSRSMQEFWHRHVTKNKVDVGGSVFAVVGRLGTVKRSHNLPCSQTPTILQYNHRPNMAPNPTHFLHKDKLCYIHRTNFPLFFFFLTTTVGVWSWVSPSISTRWGEWIISEWLGAGCRVVYPWNTQRTVKIFLLMGENVLTARDGEEWAQ